MKRALVWTGASVLITVLFHLLTVAVYPYYVMMRLKRSNRAAINSVFHAPRVTARSRDVVRPSPDLLYSACGFDLSEGPLVVAAPVPQGTYWSVSMFAANTDNFFVVNDRQLGADQVKIVVVSQGDTPAAPEGYLVVESPTTRGVVLFRMLITDEESVDSLIKVQKQASCKPLG